MTLAFHPKLGAVLVCRYEPGFKVPEMVKTRPVVVITPRLRHRHGLCTVVPLSTTPPTRAADYHCELDLGFQMPAPWRSDNVWAKADMLATVGFHRLDLIKLGRDRDGRRKYLQRSIPDEQLRRLQECVLRALCLHHFLTREGE